MKKYYYESGDVAKKDDIIFYSESDNHGNLHYADSIGILIELESKLHIRCYALTMDDGLTFKDYLEELFNTVSIEYLIDNNKKDDILTCVIKVGTYPNDENMLSKEFAKEYHNRYKRNKIIGTLCQD